MRFALALAAALCCTPAMAMAQAPDDTQLFEAGGGTWLLESDVDGTVFRSAPLRAHLQRIGLVKTCAIAREAVRLATADNREAFRPLLVATMRTEIPAERFAERGWHSFLGTLAAYRARVVDALLRDGAPIYARARAGALSYFEREAERTPALAGGNWADIFTDWDLSRDIAVQNACHQYTLVDPAVGKRVFDRFYQRKETR